MNTTLRDELIALAQEDQRVRAELAADGSLFHGYHPRMEFVHRRNSARLDQILATHGWPGRDLVGDEGSRAAWMILQHAISSPHFQRQGLVLLEEAAGRGDIPPIEVAMLEDRIRVFEGRPQRYGTQSDWDEDGQMSPLPIDDDEHVDERRRDVGLPPLEERTREVREDVAASGERCPVDFADHRRQMDAWARSVGWRT